jgi:hypothetical protein
MRGQNSSVSESMSPLDVPVGASKRPQTRPASHSGSVSVASMKPHSAGAPPATHPSFRSPSPGVTPTGPNAPEAAFVDIADDLTPSSIVRAKGQMSGRGDGSRLTKLAPVLAGGALIVALAVLGYVYSLAPHNVASNPGQGHDAPAHAGEVRVSFASTPDGAEVFHEGKSLGRTPFVSTFPTAGSGDRPWKFTFKLEGFMDEVIAEKLETATLKIHARMRAQEPGEAPDESGKKAADSEYKENPY